MMSRPICVVTFTRTSSWTATIHSELHPISCPRFYIWYHCDFSSTTSTPVVSRHCSMIVVVKFNFASIFNCLLSMLCVWTKATTYFRFLFNRSMYFFGDYSRLGQVPRRSPKEKLLKRKRYFTGQIPFLPSNQHCRSTEGRRIVEQLNSRSPSIITCCSILLPEIIMQYAFNVILWTSADICVVHDDLGQKNRTTRYNWRFSATSLALRVIFSGGTTEQHVIIAGFGELAAVG